MISSFRHLLNRFDAERVTFRLTTSYRRIEQLEKQEQKKYFTVTEQKEFQSEINRIFKDSIRQIRSFCPALTDEDLVFCYLAAEWDLPNSTMCYCFGNCSSLPIKQRKYRIKEKMTEAQCEAIFDCIFNKKC
jgi:hypothetical protein